jgi:hypothetical protein
VKQTRLYAVIACALLALPGGALEPTIVSAQTSITLEGRVLDEDGAPIANAQIALVEPVTGERRETLTRATGEFRILSLSPGTYVVTASAIGFRPLERVAELVVGQRPQLSFDLVRHAIELESIDVQAASVSATELRRSSVSTPVLEQEIRNLPLSTRNAMDLAGLAPGIRSFRPPGGHALPAAGALRGERFINLYIDGMELKNLYDGNLVGFPQTGSPLPADALKEFRVLLQPYDAAYARAAAYAVSAETHRGTNEMQGSVFGFMQHRDLVATNDFLRGVPNFVGADFERQQVGMTVRGPILRNRMFYAAAYELSSTRSYIPVVPGRPAIDPGIWDTHAGVFVAPHRNQTGLLRLTYIPGPAHTLDAITSLRQLWNESRFGGPVSNESRIEDTHLINTVNLRHRWVASDRLANELSLQFVGWSNSGGALRPQPVADYPGLLIGAPAPSFELDERHFRVVNRMTWAADRWRGAHLLNVGVEIARVSIDNFFPIFSRGRFDFQFDSSTVPRQARISVGTIHPGSERDARTAAAGWVTGFYLNHEWRPAANLVLNLGVRHDAELGLLNNDHEVPWAADPELAANPTLQPYLNRGDRTNDLDNFSPRAAFSWDVFTDARTFLRGGFGIIHDRIPSFIAFQEQQAAAWRTYTFEQPGTADPEVLRQRALAGEGLVGVTLIANDMETPRNRQWSIGLGHEITPSLTLQLDFIHQDVSNLFAEMNLNWLDESASVPRRVLSERHGDIVVWDDFARARYRALLGQVTYQPDPQLRLNLAYTLGHAEAEWDGANQSVPAAAAKQFYVMQRTGGDERHRFVLSGLIPLPLATRLALLATVASPRPYRAFVGQDLNLNSFLFDDWIDGRRYVEPPGTWRHWYRVLDVRLARAVALPGGMRGSLIAEAYNVFNSENYSAYQGRQRLGGTDNASFRQPGGVFGTRQLQLGARVEF